MNRVVAAVYGYWLCKAGVLCGEGNRIRRDVAVRQRPNPVIKIKRVVLSIRIAELPWVHSFIFLHSPVVRVDKVRYRLAFIIQQRKVGQIRVRMLINLRRKPDGFICSCAAVFHMRRMRSRGHGTKY